MPATWYWLWASRLPGMTWHGGGLGVVGAKQEKKNTTTRELQSAEAKCSDRVVIVDGSLDGWAMIFSGE